MEEKTNRNEGQVLKIDGMEKRTEDGDKRRRIERRNTGEGQLSEVGVGKGEERMVGTQGKDEKVKRLE